MPLYFSLGSDLTICSYWKSSSTHSIYTKFIPGYSKNGVYSLGKFFSYQYHSIFVTTRCFTLILNSVERVLLAYSVQALCQVS